MGIFSDAKKWFDANKPQNSIADAAQSVLNYAVDGVQFMANGAIDTAQYVSNKIFQTDKINLGFGKEAIAGALDSTSQGVEASVGSNVFTEALSNMAQKLRDSKDNSISDSIDNVQNEFNNAVNSVQDKVEDLTNDLDETVDSFATSAAEKTDAFIDGTTNAIENAANTVAGKTQEVVNDITTAAQDFTNDVIDTAENVANTASQTFNNTVEAVGAAGQSAVENVENGIDAVTGFANSVTDRVGQDMNVMGEAFGQTALGSGMKEVLEFLQKGTKDTIENIQDVFKTGNDITEKSLKNGVEKVTEAVGAVGTDVEVGLKNGTSLIFQAAKDGVEIFSSDNLSTMLGKSDKDGKLSKNILENVLDKIKESQGIIPNMLSEKREDMVEQVTNGVEQIMQGLTNNSQQR